jgi:hypothetical protein
MRLVRIDDSIDTDLGDIRRGSPPDRQGWDRLDPDKLVPDRRVPDKTAAGRTAAGNRGRRKYSAGRCKLAERYRSTVRHM